MARPTRSLRDLLPEPDLLRRRAVRVGTSLAVIAASVVALSVLGVPRLEAYASARLGGGEPLVRFVNPPAWAAGDLGTALREVARGRISCDPLRRDDLDAARSALLATGWFDDVIQVRRVNACEVEIAARFAQPFAVVRDAAGGTDHLVDVRGRVLPRSYPAGSAPLPAVIGARLVTGADGRPAVHPEDRAAAFAVLDLFRGRPWHGQIAEVHLSGDATGLRLLTDRGCAIRWGRPPGQEMGAEVPAARKLGYLDYHHEHYGHVDRGFLRELDITGDVVVGR